MLDLTQALKFAESLAVQTGEIIEQGKSKIEVVTFKDRQDIATNVDLQAEAFIISAIKQNYPDHQIISEEAGDNHQESDYAWIIDPLDGTKEYLRDLPYYNTNFALMYQHQPVLSVVYHPVGHRLYCAAKNMGAFENGRRITVNQISSLKDAFIYTYLPSYKTGYQEAKNYYQQIFNLSRKSYRIRGSAEAATTLCYLASGKLEGAINFAQSKAPDIIPGHFIALEAGAIVTNLLGKPIINNDYSQGFIASNSHLHPQIIATLNQAVK